MEKGFELLVDQRAESSPRNLKISSSVIILLCIQAPMELESHFDGEEREGKTFPAAVADEATSTDVSAGSSVSPKNWCAENQLSAGAVGIYLWQVSLELQLCPDAPWGSGHHLCPQAGQNEKSCSLVPHPRTCLTPAKQI